MGDWGVFWLLSLIKEEGHAPPPPLLYNLTSMYTTIHPLLQPQHFLPFLLHLHPSFPHSQVFIDYPKPLTSLPIFRTGQAEVLSLIFHAKRTTK